MYYTEGISECFIKVEHESLFIIANWQAPKIAIYRSVPLPPSQPNLFPLVWCDCCHPFIEEGLQSEASAYCFKNHYFTCAYEVIIWKNNHKTQQDVVSITALFMKESNIQSSKNCYYILRLAVASWMKNDLKVCDNSIIEPSPGCVQIWRIYIYMIPKLFFATE